MLNEYPVPAFFFFPLFFSFLLLIQFLIFFLILPFNFVQDGEDVGIQFSVLFDVKKGLFL